MATLRENIKTIIEELKVIQSHPQPYRDTDDEFPLPRMIATSNGGSIIISRKIDKVISSVATQLMESDQQLARTTTCSEWKAMVRRTFGPALANIDLGADSIRSADLVLSEIKAALKKQVPDRACREYAFGCTLFSNVSVKPFQIGPVRFEPRLAWLTRNHSEGHISAVTQRRVEQVWRGRRGQKRKVSFDSMAEKDILEAISSGPFVCSVSASGLASEAGLQKSLTGARLAMAAIALLWREPSKVLAGMNLLFDRRIHSQMALSYIPGKLVLAGVRLSNMPHGPWMKDGEWEAEFENCSEYFCIAGQILEYVLDPVKDRARPKMIGTLAQALLWFHEGAREDVAVMAIVKYSAVLDALACGGKAQGIRKLINARLGILDNIPIWPDGPTLKQAIEDIYSEGRSRTIHGTNNKLANDWSELRGLAEQFARLCLMMSLKWAVQNPSSDAPEQLSR